MNLVDEEIQRFFKQTGVEATYQTEAYYHAQWHLYRQQLNLFDAAMENQDVPKMTRQAVIRMVLFGGPNEAEAIDRLRQQQEAVEAIKWAPLPSLTIPGQPPGPPRYFDNMGRW